MKTKYYLFWIQSSPGTDRTTVRAYESEQSKENLQKDLEKWCEGFGAWHVSENCVSYGWKEIKNTPKNRKECLAKHAIACDLARKYNKLREKYAALLGLPPFNK